MKSKNVFWILVLIAIVSVFLFPPQTNGNSFAVFVYLGYMIGIVGIPTLIGLLFSSISYWAIKKEGRNKDIFMKKLFKSSSVAMVVLVLLSILGHLSN